MKKTLLSLRGPALAALLVASPASGMINFTFDQMTVSNNGSPDYVIDSPFTITKDGLTLTGSIGGTDPQVNATGIFLRPNQSEDLLILEFDKPVIVESVTVGRFQFSSSTSMKVLVGGPGGVPNTSIAYDSPAATTYLMPSIITDIELAPGLNDFRINGNNESFMDISDVSVTVVPEPESAGILLGVAGLTFVLARRRRN